MLAVLLAFGYLLQPIEVAPGLFSSAAERNPALRLLGILAISATLPAGPGLGDRASTSVLVRADASSSRERSVFPLCREQCRKPAGASGLSARDRAEPGLELAEPALAVRVSASGDSPDLRSRGSLAESGDRWSHRTRRAPDRCDPGFKREENECSKLDLARWLALVFIPSSWLMGVTTYLTTDLAAIPLLWVIPLAIYLVSFILAFASIGSRRSPHREPVCFPTLSHCSCW